MEGFLQRICKKLWKKKCLEHQTLGRRVICSSEPSYYIVDCRISNNESCFPQLLPFSPPAHNWFFWSTVIGVPVHFLLAIFTLSFLSFLVSTLFLSSIAMVNSRPNSNVFPHPLTTANLSSFKDLVKWSWDQGRQTGVTDDLAF